MAAITSYRNYEAEAKDLVQSLIVSSLQKVKEEDSSAIKWPTVDQLTPATGQSAIEDFIQSWELDSSWLHHTTYKGHDTEDTGLHSYAVIFSQPSRRKPVPRATVTVFFYIKCHQSQVLVFYIVEGQRVVLRPGVDEFKEVWLKMTIKNKLAITSNIHL